MRNVEIFVASSKIPLGPSAIPQDWILEGSPVTRTRVVSTSEDHTAMVVVWDCTAGRFNWFYNLDETVSVVEGGMSLTDGSGTRTVTAGDVVYFPAGSQAMWTVDSYIRKIAIIRQPIPANVSLGLRAVRRVQKMVRPVNARAQAGFSIVRPDPEFVSLRSSVSAPVPELENVER